MKLLRLYKKKHVIPIGREKFTNTVVSCLIYNYIPKGVRYYTALEIKKKLSLVKYSKEEIIFNNILSYPGETFLRVKVLFLSENQIIFTINAWYAELFLYLFFFIIGLIAAIINSVKTNSNILLAVITITLFFAFICLYKFFLLKRSIFEINRLIEQIAVEPEG